LELLLLIGMQHAANRVLQFFLLLVELRPCIAMHLIEVFAVHVQYLFYLILLCRVELEFVGQDGGRHRPIMIHRALYGSVERFFAVLLEHYGGAFRVWLAPVQVRVAPISEEKHGAYAREVMARLSAAGLRADADLTPEKVGAKIRTATLAKIPYILVVGDKEAAARTVAPRTREGKQLEVMPIDDFVARLRTEAAEPKVA